MRYFAAFLFFLSTPLMAEPIKIVTDIPPVAFLVAEVAGTDADVTALVANDAAAHDFALRPSDIAALRAADLVVWMGNDLTAWMQQAITTADGDKANLILSQLDALNVIKTENGLIDPHQWLDPLNAKVWLDGIAAALAAADPENAAAYRDRAATSIANIDALTDEIGAAMAGFETPFITLHDGSRYFEQRFDTLAVARLSGVDHHHISPRQLQSVRDVVDETDVACLIGEPGVDAHLVETIFADRPATVVELDLMGGQMVIGPDAYAKLLRSVSDGILSCAPK